MFLNPQEAQNELGISYSSLLRLVKAGTIPCQRIGKSLRFPRSYFEKLEHEALHIQEANDDSRE